MPISITHLAAGTSWWIYAVVITAVALHIGGGLVAIVSGYGAVSMRKGGARHLLLGKVFVVAMLIMGTVGAVLSIPIHQRGNIGGGILAVYFALTGWMAVKRRAGTIGTVERVAAMIPLGVSVLFFSWGVQATMNGGKLDAYGSPLYYVFGSLAALCASLDLKVIWQGGVSGVQRLARHVWRMCFSLFVAAGSFFIGQQKVMPAFMHGSPILLVLGLAPLGFMIFWLVRIRVAARPRALTRAIPT